MDRGKDWFGRYPDDPLEISNLVARNAKQHADKVARGSWWSRHSATVAAGITAALVVPAVTSEYFIAGTVEQARAHRDMQRAMAYGRCMNINVEHPQPLGGQTVELSQLTLQNLRDCGLNQLADGIEQVWSGSPLGERPAISGSVELPDTRVLVADANQVEADAGKHDEGLEALSLLGGLAAGSGLLYGAKRLRKRFESTAY